MKLVKESLFEKFTEDSDPVSDMGIGVRHEISKWLKELNEKDTNENALIECAWHGKTEWVEYLLNNGANVHFANDCALRFASHHGHVEIVKLLLAAGANVFANEGGPLQRAKKEGHTEVIKILQDHIDNLIVKESLFEKFTEDSDPIADLGIGTRHLISKWMKGKGEEDTDNNALVACARRGKTEWVEYLLNRGADGHAVNDLALRYASENGYAEVVKLLLNAGANVHAANDEALRWASNNGHTEVVRILLNAGADVHAGENFPLRYASGKGYTEIVKILLNAGADVLADDWALRWASHNGHTEVVKILLKAGANVHAANDRALRYASEYGHAEVVKILQDHIKKNEIKESLHEKFVEDSDPIKDLGIGTLPRALRTNTKGFSDDEFAKWMVDLLPAILNTDKIPEDILGKQSCINWKYFRYIEKFMHDKRQNDSELEHRAWLFHLGEKLEELGFERIGTTPNRYDVNEKFTEDSDPIQDLGIGIHNRSFDDEEKFIQFIFDIIPIMLGAEDIPNNILTTTEFCTGTLPTWLFKSIVLFLTSINTKWKNKSNLNFSMDPFDWPHHLKKKLLDAGYEFLHEKTYEQKKLTGRYVFFPHSIWHSFSKNIENLGFS